MSFLISFRCNFFSHFFADRRFSDTTNACQKYAQLYTLSVVFNFLAFTVVRPQFLTPQPKFCLSTTPLMVVVPLPALPDHLETNQPLSCGDLDNF